MSKKILISALIMFWLGFTAAFAESSNVMILHDVTADAGETILVELEIVNDDEFVGFNLDIPVPDGFTYVEGSAELFRKTNHQLAFVINDQDIAKVIAFSFTNDAFEGNEGTIVSFELETPSTPGVYDLVIEAPIIGNIDAQDILTGTVDAVITLEGDEPEPGFNLELVANPADGGTLTGAGEYDEGTDVTVSATPNAGFEFVNWTDEGNNEVSDQASFVYTMPAEDVVLTANFEEDDDPDPDPDPENIMKIHDITATAGEIVTIELEVLNDEEFVGFNLDIPLPDGFEFVEGSEELFRNTNHEVMFNVTEDNVAKIIAFSITNDAFLGNDGVIFSMDVMTPDTPGEYPLEIVNGVLGNVDAEDILTDTIDGLLTLEGEAEPENIMLVHDIEAEAGDIITVEVEIMNDEEFVGFNLDIPLPDGFEYVEGSAELFRGADHDFGFNVTDAGLAKIIAFSITNSAFTGNEGVVFTFDLETPAFGGEFPLEITNAVIGNIDAQNILTGTVDGTIFLEGETLPENIMKIHDITAEAGEIVTIELEILNDEEFVGFNLDIPLPDGFEYIEGSEELFRNTNHEVMFNVTDENLAKIIAFSITNDAFLGNEGVIFSFDVQTPNTEGEFPLEIVGGIIGNIDAEDILTGTIDGTLTLVGEVETENIMKIHDITAETGDIVTIEMEIINDDEFVGFNLDIPLPDGFNFVEGTTQLFRGTDHEFAFNVIEGNIAKIIAFSLTNDAFEGNDGVIFSFDVETPDMPGEYILEVINGVIGNIDAEDILTGTIDGTVILEGEEPDPDPENIMKIHDIVAEPGDIVTIELEILNDEEFVGFNLDIPLPDGFEYIEGSEELFRKTNHEVMFNVTDENLAKIISFSITNDAFLGNEGVIFSFDVQTPSVPGEYPLEIVNGIIGNIDAEDILTGTIDGTLTLEGEVEPENIMKIHDIVADAGDIITIELEILNDEEFVGFNLDIPLPDGFEYIEGSEELFRKTNHEVMFNVTDENLAKIISFSITNDAFLGNEGVIFSFDVQTPNMPGEYPLEIVNGIIGNIDAEDILTGTIDGTLVLEGEIEPENIMLIHDIFAETGDTVTVEVEIENDEEFVGFQLRIPLPVGFEFVEESAQLFRSTDHDFMFSVDEENVASVIAFSITNDAFLGNDGVIFSFDVVTPMMPGEYPLEIVDAIIGNIDAEDILTETIDGTVFLEGEPIEEYDLTLIANPEEGGEVTGAGTYFAGDEVEVDAIPNEGWMFINWTDLDGNVVSEDAFNVIEMPEADLTLIANFEAIDYTLTLIANPEEGGTVTGAGVYNFGDEVEVDAIPNEGWMFINWTDEDGNFVSDDAFNVIEMPAADLTLVANFEAIDYTLTLIANPEEGGEVTGAGVYNVGDLVEVDAIPNDGWAFVNWTDEDGNFVSDDAFNVIEMPAADVTLVANFEFLTYTLTFVVLDEDTEEPIDDATITLDGVEYEAGMYVFENLEPGLYEYTVSREDYVTFEGTVDIVDEDVTETVLLEFFDDDVSVGEVDVLNLSIFPNPASSVMMVESNKVISDLRLIDMLGQVVYNATVQDLTYEVNVSGFRNGVYFLQVNTASGLSTHRVQIVN